MPKTNRSAKTGKFVRTAYAKKHPLTTVREASVARSKAAICGHPKPAILETARDRDFYSFVIK